MKQYKLVDYWQNGNVDVMLGGELLAEIHPHGNGFVVRFSVEIRQPDKDAVNRWLQKHVPELVALSGLA